MTDETPTPEREAYHPPLLTRHRPLLDITGATKIETDSKAESDRATEFRNQTDAAFLKEATKNASDANKNTSDTTKNANDKTDKAPEKGTEKMTENKNSTDSMKTSKDAFGGA